MPRYKFKARPFEEVTKLILDAFDSRSSKIVVPVVDSLGYVLAEDIVSDRDLPPYDIAFYDGYAVRSEDTAGASASNPIKLKLVGRVFSEKDHGKFKVDKGCAVYVSSNSPIPEGANAIVRIEYTEEKDNEVLIKKEVEPEQDMILKGDDIRKGELILSEGRFIRPQDIALLLELGILRIRVYRKPRVGIMAIGNELLERMNRGIVYPDNYSVFIAKSLELLGAEPHHLGIVSDNIDEIKAKVLDNIHIYDMMLLVAGASIGLNDYTGRSLEEIGEVIFHGTNLSPGKVSGLVKIENKPVFLVPGHVGSAISCLYNFVYPLISKMFFDSAKLLPVVYAELTSDVDVKKGSYTFRTVALKWKDGKIYATPHIKKLGGSTLLTIFTEAQGYILVPPKTEAKKGDIIKVTLFSNMESLNIS